MFSPLSDKGVPCPLCSLRSLFNQLQCWVEVLHLLCFLVYEFYLSISLAFSFTSPLFILRSFLFSHQYISCSVHVHTFIIGADSKLHMRDLC